MAIPVAGTARDLLRTTPTWWRFGVGRTRDQPGSPRRTNRMQRTPVDSSTMVSVGYEADSDTLEIEFVSGHVYQYFDVPSSVRDELLASESAGGYFNAAIRGH
jgi:hypothetical protein